MATTEHWNVTLTTRNMKHSRWHMIMDWAQTEHWNGTLTTKPNGKKGRTQEWNMAPK